MGNPDNEDTFFNGNQIKTEKNERQYIEGLKKRYITLFWNQISFSTMVLSQKN